MYQTPWVCQKVRPVSSIVASMASPVTGVKSPVPLLAADFTAGLGELFFRAAAAARARTGIDRVVLSGGVFQNEALVTRLKGRLQAEAFTVITHREVPTNDGGLALGQIAVAAARLHGENGKEENGHVPGSAR